MTKDTASKLLILVVFLVSCTSVKKAEKVVLNDKEASERVFQQLAFAHPCANDTDPLENTDTIVSVQHYVSRLNSPKFQGFTIPPINDTIIKTITLNRLKMGYVVDTRLLGVARDSLKVLAIKLDASELKSYCWQKRFWVLLISLVILGFIKYKL